MSASTTPSSYRPETLGETVSRLKRADESQYSLALSVMTAGATLAAGGLVAFGAEVAQAVRPHVGTRASLSFNATSVALTWAYLSVRYLNNRRRLYNPRQVRSQTDSRSGGSQFRGAEPQTTVAEVQSESAEVQARVPGTQYESMIPTARWNGASQGATPSKRRGFLYNGDAEEELRGVLSVERDDMA